MIDRRAPGTLTVIVCLLSCTAPLRGQDFSWQMQPSVADASLRGIDVVDRNIIWVSGSAGTVLRSVDGGRRWRSVAVPGAEQLDFRDIEALDAKRAIVVAAGQPARFYRTTDGGRSWNLCYEHPAAGAFFNAISFFDHQHAIAMSDPVAGRLLLVQSRDGGRSWQPLPLENRPATADGEAGFAGSGTNMQVVDDAVYIGLGGALANQQHPTSRIVYSRDRGRRWQSVTVPIPRSPSRGIFSLAFADDNRAIAIGGDYQQPDHRTGLIAVSDDDGRHWRVPDGRPPRGYRSAVAFGRRGRQPIAVCVGPNGTDVSTDHGANWTAASDEGFHTLAFSPDGREAWAAGGGGRIARWNGQARGDDSHTP